MAARGPGDVVQSTLLIPPWIQAGLDDGTLFRVGSVVRRVKGGSIAKHLDEVPRAERVVEEVARRAARVAPKTMATAVLITAVGAGAALVLRGRRKADQVRADARQRVDHFEESLRTYVEAGRDGILDVKTVDRLIANLDEIKALVDCGNPVVFSLAQLEPLFRLVIEHTATLARDYSVPVADVQPRKDYGGVAVVTQLRRHLDVQKRILREAA